MTEIATGMNFDTGSSGEGAVILDKQDYGTPLDSYWKAKNFLEQHAQQKAARQQAQQKLNEDLMKDLNVNADGVRPNAIPRIQEMKKGITDALSAHYRKNGLNSNAREAVKPLYDQLYTYVSGEKGLNDHYKGELARFEAMSKTDNNLNYEKTRENLAKYNALSSEEAFKLGTPSLLVFNEDSIGTMLAKSNKAIGVDKGEDYAKEQGGNIIKGKEYGLGQYARAVAHGRGQDGFNEKMDDAYARFAQLNPQEAEKIQNEVLSPKMANLKLTPAELYYYKANPLEFSTVTDLSEGAYKKEAAKGAQDRATEKFKYQPEAFRQTIFGLNDRANFVNKADGTMVLASPVIPYSLEKYDEVKINPITKEEYIEPISVDVVGREIVNPSNGVKPYWRLKLSRMPKGNIGNVVKEGNDIFLETSDPYFAFQDQIPKTESGNGLITAVERLRSEMGENFYEGNVVGSGKKGSKKIMGVRQKTKAEPKAQIIEGKSIPANATPKYSASTGKLIGYELPNGEKYKF